MISENTMNNKAISLEQINQRIIKMNEEYQKVFNDSGYKNQYLNRKAYAFIMQKIYAFYQTSSTEQKQKNKQTLLQLFRSYTKNFINTYTIQKIKSSHILASLQRTTNYQDFQQLLSQKWKHFKIFTFHCIALLQSANESFMSTWISNVKAGIHIDLNSQEGIFPVPVIAMNLFKRIILDKYQSRIEHILLQCIKKYRRQLKFTPQNVKNLLQLIWSCGLAQFARIKMIKGVVDFYREQNLLITKHIMRKINVQDFFAERILNHILQQSEIFYAQEYEHKLRTLFPVEQFRSIKYILERQFEFCEQFFISKAEKKRYIAKIYQKIVFNNLQGRLKANASFKQLVYNFKHDSLEKFDEIKVFFEVLKGALYISQNKLKTAIKPLELIFSEVITQKGKQINLKVNKRKEYIVQMLALKKSIDKILQDLSGNNFVLFSIKDKSFKKILDSIEAARNLADFTDFTIKQCIKLKLDDQRCYERFSDIFLLLNSISSTDSFLLYHQQFLAKRIIDSLNEPKLQFQLLMLKKLSQRMGVMSISSHMSMIKDIQLSQQLTEKYNNKLPFSSFKWNLKIFNPSFWPQSSNKQKVTVQFPNCLLPQAKAIEELYHIDNQYRYLNWKLQKGISLFQGIFENKQIRFQSENSYLMILLLVAQQSGNKIIYGNLRKLVKMSKSQTQQKNDPLSMLLYVLIESKLLLRREAQNKFSPFSQSEQVQINKRYRIVQVRGKVQAVIAIRPSAQMAKNLQQSSIQKIKILKDRQKLIQAVLVKSLKHCHATGDNSISFEQLYKSIKQHHILGGFNFAQNVVKQRLQELIARQYCVRDQDDRRIYHYVA